MMASELTILCWVTLLVCGGARAKTLYVIDIGHEMPDVSLGLKLAVLSCQGLMNRDEEGDVAVYTVKEGWDQEWLDTELEQDPGWDIVIHLTIQERTIKRCLNVRQK